MRKALVVSLLAVAVSAAALFTGAALAGSDKARNPFKGKWDVVLSTPVGEISATASLQPNGKGTLFLPGHGKVPIVHQETSEWISWTIELPAVQAPDGNAHTIIGRGTLGEEGDMSGNLVIVTNVVDAESPVGYETHVGTFTAPKRGK